MSALQVSLSFDAPLAKIGMQVFLVFVFLIGFTTAFCLTIPLRVMGALQLIMFQCYGGAYGEAGAIIYWVSYEFIMVFVLLNMFIMVIVTTFDEIDAVDEVRSQSGRTVFGHRRPNF